MITVNVIELFLKSAELLADGYQEVILSKHDEDDESPAALSFDAVEEYDPLGTVEYDEIRDCSDDEEFALNFTPDSIAPYTVTFENLLLISNAFHNAIENCLTCLDDKSISTDLRADIVASLKKFEAYVAELDHFLDDFYQ